MYSTAMNTTYSARKYASFRSEEKRAWRNIKRSTKVKTKN